jgi:hypothetical protein
MGRQVGSTPTAGSGVGRRFRDVVPGCLSGPAALSATTGHAGTSLTKRLAQTRHRKARRLNHPAITTVVRSPHAAAPARTSMQWCGPSEAARPCGTASVVRARPTPVLCVRTIRADGSLRRSRSIRFHRRVLRPRGGVPVLRQEIGTARAPVLQRAVCGWVRSPGRGQR